MSKPARVGSFKSMSLSDEVTKAIDKLGFRHPTPIQRRSIPSILTGVDCVAMARTGSGKTGAFAIPTVHRLGKHSDIVGARAIVLSPTRELAMQTCKVFQLLARFTDLRIALIVGGHSMDGQFDRLMNNPDVIIATPGRLIHHLEQDGAFGLDRVEILILDEADRLFELGFTEQIESILKACPSNRQALLFSATLPSQLVRFCKAGLKTPELIRLDSDCSLSDDLELFTAFTRNEAKPAALISCIRSLCHVEKDQPLKKTIVFVATRHHVDFLGQLVEKANLASVACIYGSMEQTMRSASLAKFKAGKASVLIVTDVAARGIDIPDVDNVIHYDFPCSPKLFIHRSGRTARAGKSGLCLSIVTATDMPYLMDLLMFVDAKLWVSGSPRETSSVTAASAAAAEENDGMVVEIEEDGISAGAAAPAKNVREIEIGGIPYVDEDVEMLARMLEDDSDLQSGNRSMELAMGPYFKTRPSASKQAVRNAWTFTEQECGGQQKLLSCPLSIFDSTLAPGMKQDADLRMDILNSLRSFRPSQASHQHSTKSAGTIVKTETRKKLEQRVLAPKRAKEMADRLLAQDQADAEAMSDDSGNGEDEEDKTRVLTERKKPAKKAAAASTKVKKTDFRSPQFFHAVTVKSAESIAKEQAMDLEQYRMDLVPENTDEMKKAHYAKKWDSKKMNYKTVRVGADGKVINEAGKRVSKKDLEKGKLLYKDWAKKTKNRIQKVGEVEAPGMGPKRRDSSREEAQADREERKSSKGRDSEGIVTPKAVTSRAYNGEIPWDYLTNKQKRQQTKKLKAGVTSRGTEQRAETLKTTDSIAKARKLKSNRQILQNPKKRKEFHKENSETFAKKQEGKFKAKAAPGRSWTKGKKPLGRK